MRPVNEVEGRYRGLVVHRLHALFGQGSRVFNSAIRIAVYHTPGTIVSSEIGKVGLLGIVLVLGLFLRVQVIQVPEELIEPMVGR